MKLLPPRSEMENAFFKGDASYDGIFFVGVKTTGIFCRPSCPAKRPRPDNIRFIASTGDALFAGFRPCKRCQPLNANGHPPEWVGRLLARIDASPTQRLTAPDIQEMGIDPARARRYFLKHHRMTFNAYCRSRRLGEALRQIRVGADLDDVALDHGYESNSGFRTAFMKTFGRTPGRSRGADCILTSWAETPVGPMITGATDQGVCLLEFTDRRMLETQLAALRRLFSRAVVPGRNAHLEQLNEELARYFAGELKHFCVALVYPGTPFQQRVWSELLRIPYGETRSYEDIARCVGSPNAVRAVGRTNGANRIAVVIPCHRVVNKNGELGGYGGGLRRKQFLLDLERANTEAPSRARSDAQAVH